jgi:hypothetical protein
MVGERGFEPPTPWSRTRCSTRLSHSPTLASALILLHVWLLLRRTLPTNHWHQLRLLTGPPIREAYRRRCCFPAALTCVHGGKRVAPPLAISCFRIWLSLRRPCLWKRRAVVDYETRAQRHHCVLDRRRHVHHNCNLRSPKWHAFQLLSSHHVHR